MKKITWAVVSIIILAVFGAPILGGFITERTIRSITSDINREYSEKEVDVSFEIMRYDRKLFSSQIEWKIKAGFLKEIYNIDEIVFMENAKHRFARVVSYTSLKKNDWFEKLINQKLNGKNPLKIKTEYNYLGNIKGTITADSFVLKDGDEIYDFKQGKIYAVCDKKIKNISVKVDWKGLSAEDKLIIDDILFNLKVKNVLEYIWTGNSIVSAKEIYVKDVDRYFEFSDFRLNCSVDVDKKNDVLSLNIGSNFSSAAFKEEEIKNYSVKLGITGINAKGYNNLIKTINEANRYFEKGGDIVEKQAAFFTSQVIAAYEKILKKGLEIKVADLEAESKEGKIKGDILFGLKEDVSFDKLFSFILKPAAALDLFYLKSDFIMPYKFAADEQEALYPIYPGMQTGLFVKKGENLVHDAEIKDGKLILNGEEVMLE